MTDSKKTTADDAMNRVLPASTSPAAVAEAMEDPEVFAQIARGDLYVQLARMRQLAQSPNMAVGQRLDYVRFLARMGKVEKPEVEQNAFSNVPAINIILPGSGQSTQIGTARVINGDSTPEGASDD